MGDKKDIGKAFKDKLEELHVSPKDLVWDNILEELDKKEKKKRIIPIWFKIAGIISVLFIVGKFAIWFNEKNVKESVIVDKQEYEKQDIEEVIVVNKKNDSLNHLNPNKNQKNYNNLVKVKNQNQQQIVPQNSILSNPKNNELQEFTSNSEVFKNQNIAKMTTKKKNQKIDNFSNPRGINSKNKLAFTFAKLPSLNNRLDINLVTLVNNLDEKTMNKRFDISIKGTPIYYGSLSEGSSISQRLDDNKKTNNITSSYEVQTSFQIFKSIRIRTGISKIDLESETANVAGSAVINSQAITFNNLDFFDDGLDEDPFGFIDVDSEPVENYFQIIQSTNYIEIPLEISYTILDRKINVNVITGLSALILNGNHIIIDGKTVGEITNLEKLSYTGNLGLGLNYKLSKHINLIMEPIYKLQFSTYTNNVNSKPYYFGVYSGVSYKF